MKTLFLFLGCYFFTLITIPLYGQFYELTRYSDDNGLPSRRIRNTYQDNKGFLWIAGDNGLFKFDGQEFASFYASLKDSVGLRSNKITAIHQTSDQKIWIGTDNGLHVLEKNNITYVKASFVEDK